MKLNVEVSSHWFELCFWETAVATGSEEKKSFPLFLFYKNIIFDFVYLV